MMEFKIKMGLVGSTKTELTMIKRMKIILAMAIVQLCVDVQPLFMYSNSHIQIYNLQETLSFLARKTQTNVRQILILSLIML